MPNVTLIHTFPKKEQYKAAIFKKAWEFIREGMSRKDAFKKSWDISTKLTTKFWTNASPEDIMWVIKTHVKDGVVRKDMIRKHDGDTIQHPLDWVYYHLRRAGFEMENNPKRNLLSVRYEIPKLEL